MSKQAYLHCLLHQRQDHQEDHHEGRDPLLEGDHQEKDHQPPHQDHQEEDHQEEDHREEDHQEEDRQEGAMKTMGTKETVGIRRHD